jgi:hypothetical protein
MRRKLKASKIGGVIFLTILIWVWADLALERQMSLSSVNVRLTAATDPALAVAFLVDQTEDEFSNFALLHSVDFIGPEATINKVKRVLGENLEFVLVADELGLTEAGTHSVALLDFLRQSASREPRLAGLTVDSCDPNVMTLQVERLVRMKIPVRCMDQREIPVEEATTEPAEVDIFVPQGWTGEQRVAWVKLTDSELDRARLNPSPVSKQPYITVLRQRRDADIAVKVSMPDIEQRLEVAVIRPKLGFVLSPNLQNKYTVVMDPLNLNNAIEPISIRATEEARQAYDNSLYHVLLEVQDNDAEVAEVASRRLRYNFPPEFVGSGQIRLDIAPRSVTFKLVPKNGNTQASP